MPISLLPLSVAEQHDTQNYSGDHALFSSSALKKEKVRPAVAQREFRPFA